MSEKFYDKGLQFSCKQCSHCCKDEPGFVYLSKSDLTNLLEWFKLEKSVFIEKYCRFVPFYDGSEVLSLQEKPNYDCIFLNNGCSAYMARPTQCSTYPFWTYLLKDKESWDREALDCPGINTGNLHSKELIEEAKFKYENNHPLRREEV